MRSLDNTYDGGGLESVDFNMVSEEDILYISASDLAKIIKEKPELNKPPIEDILEKLGMDTKSSWEVRHDNRKHWKYIEKLLVITLEGNKRDHSIPAIEDDEGYTK